MRSLGVLLAEGLDVHVVDLPASEDPDTLLRRAGLEGWKELRAKAADPVDFIFEHLIRRSQGRDPNGVDSRQRALQATTDLLSRVTDPIRRELLIERAEMTLGLGRSVLLRSAERKAAAGAKPAAAGPGAVRQPQPAGSRTNLDAAEAHLLKSLIQAPEALEPAREQLAPADFRDPVCAALARHLWESPGTLPEAGPEASLARELASEGRSLDWVEEARGAVRVLVQRRLRDALKERQQRLREAGSAEESARLMDDIGQIARSLRDWGVAGY